MKPLGRKAYGSIPHLSMSLLGEGDHRIHEGQEKILTVKSRSNDTIVVLEKLDGGNVAIAKIDGAILPLTRSGYSAYSSTYLHHHLFADWLGMNKSRFSDLLAEGEWISGEWLAMAHGTLYRLQHEPFVAFDLWTNNKRAQYHALVRRGGMVFARKLHEGNALSISEAFKRLEQDNPHGALEEQEGVVYRCETPKTVEFLAKCVRTSKINGKYLDKEIYNQNLEHYLSEKSMKKIHEAQARLQAQTQIKV